MRNLTKLEQQIKSLHKNSKDYAYISYTVTNGVVETIAYEKYATDNIKIIDKQNKLFNALLHEAQINEGLVITTNGRTIVFDEEGI